MSSARDSDAFWRRSLANGNAQEDLFCPCLQPRKVARQGASYREDGTMKLDSTTGHERIPQNASVHESAQAILGLPVPRVFDIARLRPDSLPRGDRFETVADARARRDTELDHFKRIAGLSHVADRLSSCSAEYPCAEVSCAICGRLFRRWFTGQALRHQRALALRVLTVALELVPSKRLPKCDLLALKRRAAQRLRRAAPSAEFVLGGIEAEYRQGDDAFMVHAHLLVSPLPRDELNALRSPFASIDVARSVKLQKLKDASFLSDQIHDFSPPRIAEGVPPSKGNPPSRFRVGAAYALAGSICVLGLHFHDAPSPEERRSRADW